MEDGSIEEVTARLKLWCAQQGGGLARVEWDSVYARQEVVNRLKESLDGLGISLVEISLPPGQASNETVVRLIEKLRSRAGSVVSITDIEWAFPEGGSRLDTLVALSFKREILAALPVRSDLVDTVSFDGATDSWRSRFGFLVPIAIASFGSSAARVGTC